MADNNQLTNSDPLQDAFKQGESSVLAPGPSEKATQQTQSDAVPQEPKSDIEHAFSQGEQEYVTANTPVSKRMEGKSYDAMSDLEKNELTNVTDPDELHRMPAHIPLTDEQLRIKFDAMRAEPWNQGIGTWNDWYNIGKDVLSTGKSFIKGGYKLAHDSFLSDKDNDPNGFFHPSIQPLKDAASPVFSLPESTAYLAEKLYQGGFDWADRVGEKFGIHDREKSFENYKARHLVDQVQAEQKFNKPSIYARLPDEYPFLANALGAVVKNNLPPVEDFQDYEYKETPGGITSVKRATPVSLEQATQERDQLATSQASQTLQENAAKEKAADEDLATFGMFAAGPLGMEGMGATMLAAEGVTRFTPAIIRGLRVAGKSDAEIKAMYDAEQALEKEKYAKKMEKMAQPGVIERTARKLDTGIQGIGDRLERFGEQIPEGVKDLAPYLAGGIFGYEAAPEGHRGTGILAGAGLGKLIGPSLKLAKYGAKIPALVADVGEARRLAGGGSVGTFETLAGFPSVSEGAAKVLRFGGRNVDDLVDNAVEYAKAGIHPTALAIASGVLDSADPEQMNQLVGNGILYGLGDRGIGHAYHKLFGTDHVIEARNRKQQAADDYKTYQDLTPETRKSVDELSNWDNAINRQARIVSEAKQEYADAVASGNDAKAAAAGRNVQAQERALRIVTRANVQTRNEFGRQFVTQLTRNNRLVNGTLRAGMPNVGIHILSTQGIIDHFLKGRNPADITPEEMEEIKTSASQQGFYNAPGSSVEYQPGMVVGREGKGLVFDPTKPSVVINMDGLKTRMMIFGETPVQALNHELGHHVSRIPEFREANRDAYNLLFNQEIKDPTGKVLTISTGQYSPKDLVEMFQNTYMKGKTPEQMVQLAQIAGLWDGSRNALDEAKTAEYMREEILADLNAETLGSALGSKLDSASSHILDLARMKTKKNLLDLAVTKFLGLGGRGDIISPKTGAKFGPEIMSANREAFRRLQKLQGELSPAVRAPEKPAISRAIMMKNRAVMEMYGKYSGLFKTEMKAQVYDANGNPVSEAIPISAPNAAEGVWKKDGADTTQESGYGQIPDELSGVNIPDGGRVVVASHFVTQPDGVTPVMYTPKEAKERAKDRSNLIREALDTPDHGTPGRFEAVSDDGLTWRGTFTPLQIKAIESLPESLVPRSIKEHMLKINEMIKRGDGTRMIVDYAAVMNDNGKYQAFSPKIYDVVPIGMHFSKDGNFLVTTISVGRMFEKLNYWSQRMPGRLSLWSGNKEKFFDEFVNKYLKNWAYREQTPEGVEKFPRGLPGETALDPDPTIAQQKKEIFNDFLNLTTRETPSTAVRTKIPRKKGDPRGKDPDRTIMSMRLDHMAFLDENEHAPKVRIDYGNAISNFAPEEAALMKQQAPQEEAPLDERLRGISANYSDKDTGFNIEYKEGQKSENKPDPGYEEILPVVDLHGKTAREALQYAADVTPKDSNLGQAAEILADFPAKRLDEEKIDKVPKGTRAYRFYDKTIRFRKQGYVSPRTLVHETGHTLSADELWKAIPIYKGQANNGVDYKKYLDAALANPNVEEPAKRVIRLYISAIDQLGMTNHYFGGKIDQKVPGKEAKDFRVKVNSLEGDTFPDFPMFFAWPKNPGKYFTKGKVYTDEMKKFLKRNDIPFVLRDDGVAVETEAGKLKEPDRNIRYATRRNELVINVDKEHYGRLVDAAKKEGIWEEYPDYKGFSYINLQVPGTGEKLKKSTSKGWAANNPDKTIERGGMYGLGNVHEFVAQMWSDKQFQELMKTLKGDDQKSLFRAFVDLVAKLFGFPTESMAYSVIDASLDVAAMGDNIDFTRPTKYGGGEPRESDTRFAPEEDPENLIAVHNTTEQKLRNALKVGGLAVPSVAVIRRDRSKFDSFGDITLIARHDLVNPEMDTRSKVFNADVYSPRYPAVKFTSDIPTLRKLRDYITPIIESLPEDKRVRFFFNTEDRDTNLKEELMQNTSAQLAFAKETGNMDKFVWPTERPTGWDKDAGIRDVLRSKLDPWWGEKGSDLYNEFDGWVDDLIKKTGAKDKERIFNGYTASGNRRYMEHTLENVVKKMTKTIRNGEGFNYGVGSIRSTKAKQFKTMQQIKANRDQIITKSDMERLKDEVDTEFGNLADEAIRMRANVPTFALDAFSDDLKALAKGQYAYLKEQYPDGAPYDKWRDYLDKLRNLPTEYFEAKLQRGVGIHEFDTAVVPEGTSQEMIDELKGQGLDVVSYNPKDNEHRAQVIKDATENRSDIRFSPEEDDVKRQGAVRMNELPKSATTFSAGGMFEIGVKGIVKPSYAIEYDPLTAQAYAEAHGDHIEVGDVTTKSFAGQQGEYLHYHASPVCKRYSKSRNIKPTEEEKEIDKKSADVVARHIGELLSPVVTIENVPEYKRSPEMETIRKALKDNGYTWDENIYDAADHGAPTTRRRLIVRAIRGDVQLAKPIFVKGKSWYEAIEDLIPSLPDEENLDRAKYMTNFLESKGIDYKNVSEPLLVPGGAAFKGRLDIRRADQPAFTLLATPGRVDRVLLPGGIIKRLTPRAKARLSGVPDDYPLPKDDKLAGTILGNGVPPDLVRNVVGPVLEQAKGMTDFTPKPPNIEQSSFAFSPSEKIDSEYKKAYEKGDDEAMTRAVIKRAKKVGYDIFGYKAMEGNIPHMYTQDEAPVTFIAQEPRVASIFADAASGRPVRPVAVKLENPFDYKDDDHREALMGFLEDKGLKEVNREMSESLFGDPEEIKHDWSMYSKLVDDGHYLIMELPSVRKWIKDQGHDGFYVNEETTGLSTPANIAVFSPESIKSIEPVTQDDKGEVIPPSMRFLESVNDIRFSPEGEEVPSQEKLDEMKKRIPEYKTKITKLADDDAPEPLYVENDADVIRIYVPGIEDEVGYAIVSGTKDEDRIYVYETEVDRNYRGQHLGEALYREIAKYAHSKEAEYIFGHSVSTDAQRVRKKLFETTEEADYGFDDGRLEVESKAPLNIQFSPEENITPTQEQLKEMKKRLPKYHAVVSTKEDRPEISTDRIDLFTNKRMDTPVGYAQFSIVGDKLKVEKTKVYDLYKSQGYGESLYREIAKYAQKKGISVIYSPEVSPDAQKVRNKLFQNIEGFATTEGMMPNAIEGSKAMGSYIPSDIRYSPEENIIPVPSQEELDKMKAGLPKYKLETHKDGDKYLLDLFNEEGDHVVHGSMRIDKAGGYAKIISTIAPEKYKGKGYGEALYREMAKIAQKEKVSGIYSPSVTNDARNVRKKLFGPGYDIAGNLYGNEDGEGVSLEQMHNVPSNIQFSPEVAVIPERFTGTGKEEERRGKYVEPPKFFKKYDISEYQKGGKFLDATTGEDLTGKTYESGSISVTNGKPSLSTADKEGEIGTGSLFRTNLFKQKAGWRWDSEDHPETTTIVSVEGKGSHIYTLKADFENGIQMARYEDKASEPRLRPTGRGDLVLGNVVGQIDIRGKQHPVYDQVTIASKDTGDIRFSPEEEDLKKLTAPAGVMPQSATEVLYKDSAALPKPAKKIANASVALQLADAAENHWGGKVTSNNITPEIEEAIVNNGVDETMAAINASGKNAADWYTKAIEAALAVAGVIHKVLSDKAEATKNQFFAKEADPVRAAQFALRLPMAITSQNLSVPLNTRFAEEQFNYFQKTGKFDPSKEYGEKASSISGNLKLANVMIDKLGGILGLEDFVKKEFSVADLEKIASKVAGYKVTIAGRRGDMVNGAAIFGPKIGQGFLQNLMGVYTPVTIDLWMRRTWGRWTGDVVGDGVTAVRLGRLIKAYRDAGKKLPDQIKFLRTANRSVGFTKTGKPKKPELAVSEDVERKLEDEPEFRKSVEAFSKAATNEFQKYYKLMGQPMTPKAIAEINAIVPKDGEVTPENEDKIEKLYNRLIRDQEKISNDLDDTWDSLSTDDKKALNEEDPSKAIKKANWIEMQHAKAGRTETLENPQKNAIKPNWAKAAKSIAAELNPIDIPTDQDRVVITRIVNRIRTILEGKGVNVTNADIQALLWYPEKDLWAKLRGEEESNLKQSYDDEFINIAEKRGLGNEARRVAKTIRGY